MIDKTGRYVEQKALTVTENLHIKEPVAAIGYVYKVVRFQQLNLRIGRQSVSIQPNSISVSIPL